MAYLYTKMRWSDVPSALRLPLQSPVAVEPRCQYAVNASDLAALEDPADTARFETALGKFHQCAREAQHGGDRCVRHAIDLTMPRQVWTAQPPHAGIDIPAVTPSPVVTPPPTPPRPLSPAERDRIARAAAIRRTREQRQRESPRRPLAWFRGLTDEEILDWRGIGARYAAEIRLIRDTFSDDDVRAMMRWASDPEGIAWGGWAEHAPTISLVGG